MAAGGRGRGLDGSPLTYGKAGDNYANLDFAALVGRFYVGAGGKLCAEQRV